MVITNGEEAELTAQVYDLCNLINLEYEQF